MSQTPPHPPGDPREPNFPSATPGQGGEGEGPLDATLSERESQESQPAMAREADGPNGAAASGALRAWVVAHRRVLFAVALVLSVLTVVGTALGYGPLAVKDYRSASAEQVTVRVMRGDSLSAIGRALHKAHVVKDVAFFVRTASADPRATRIQPGYYAMYAHMRSRDAFVRFFDPSARVRTKVLVPAGARAATILERLSDRTGIPVIDFEAAVAAARTSLPSYAAGDIEGMLWPATYEFDPDATARSIISELVTTAERQHRALGLRAGGPQGLRPRQVLALASIVQAEAYQRDFAKVSRVIYNRLARGQRLQMDSTLNYALGTSKLVFTNAERRNPSPYNTYAVRGLPPGPIGAPDAAAITAALRPVQGPWLFFVTTDPTTGLTEFATTEAEFAKLRRKFQQWLASQ